MSVALDSHRISHFPSPRYAIGNRSCRRAHRRRSALEQSPRYGPLETRRTDRSGSRPNRPVTTHRLWPPSGNVCSCRPRRGWGCTAGAACGYGTGVGGLPAAAATGGLHCFPAMLTSFVGRAGAVRDVAGLLGEYRLVTVTGPGGVGKTRLAGQMAGQVAGRFTDGAWLAELAAVRDPAQVAGAVAAALGIPEQPGVPAAEALARVLAGQQLLLVLDNCEHVIGAAAQLCARLLAACDDVRVLGVAQLLDRIEDRFALLTGGDRLAAGRQRSLAATVAWSYRLLTEPERRVFRAVAVFQGPFTLEGAEAVAGPGAGPVVLRLVDCSLLVPPRAGPDGRSRYAMLETLRAYGAGLLAETGEADGVAAALAGYALRVARRAAAGGAPRSSGSAGQRSSRSIWPHRWVISPRSGTPSRAGRRPGR